VLYGSQEYGLNYHKNGFTPARLKKILKRIGLEVLIEETQGYNILVKAMFRKYLDEGHITEARIEELAGGFGAQT
jgi:hypothetical protein